MEYVHRFRSETEPISAFVTRVIAAVIVKPVCNF